MSADTIQAIARHYWDAEESRDIERIMSFFNPDARWGALGLELLGRNAIREPYEANIALYPTLSVTILRVLGNDREAAIEYEAEYTDRDGHPFKVAGVNLVRVSGGRFDSIDVYLDPRPLLDAAQG